MKTTLFLALFILFTQSSCVTTRAQLEEKKQHRADSSATDHAVAPPVVKTAYDMEDVKADVSRLMGRVDELEQQLGQQLVQARQAQSESSKSIASLQDRVEKLEKKPEPTPTPEEPKDYLAAGKTAYQSGKFSEAARAFEVAQKNDKQAEEAKFLAGESYFKLKNYRKAIVEYSKISDQHPKSAFHPKSLLKIAECFEGLGSKEDADAFYSEVVDKFGKSPEAKAAKKRLKKK